ncbi:MULTISPECIES: hypothetical protein [unclassified Arcicella]|uniref:hypothetical protein n=1 Tax=unclassified Arcicella TaxID=2644986 RepID=UPI00285D31C9|nr:MULTISPECIES: hypothetical protein [unclassified Arcicella]MDR6564958.1 hypothetical protein [Arcicella sp. BE51]MDR6814748.1 hypothetical protein [Arcicella sp. BE140]MDR6826194.1 hypothetical protein [Arcicella sp. BE139]
MAKIAFQTFSEKNQSLKDFVMCMAVKGVFFHCEIHFRDGAVGSSGNKNRGVVLISNKDREYKSGEWIFYEIPCTASQEDKMRDYFIQNLNQKYNMKGVLGSMVTGLNVDSKKAEFCSEVCFNSLTKAGIISNFGLKAQELSPSHLQTIIEKLGWKRSQFYQ